METTITVLVSSYKFACFIEYLLKEHGIIASGKGFNMDTGFRDLEFRDIKIPTEAHYIPKPIEVNLPDFPEEANGEQ